MGRKPAPQPLALSESAVPPPKARDPTETLQVISPADSLAQGKTPRSPRSPFRFGDKKTQAQAQLPAQNTQKQQQPMHVADLVQQPLDEDNDVGSSYPPISAALHPPTQAYDETTTRQQQQQQQQQTNQHPGQQPLTQQPPTQYQQQQQQSYGHNRYRQNEDKASRSNFFFHFGKSSRSTERLPPGSVVSSSATTPNIVTSTNASISIPSSQFAESRDDAMSRGADSPSLKQSSKAPGPDSSYADQQAQKPTTATTTNPSTRSDVSLSSTENDPTSAGKKGKPKSFGRLGRSRSDRDSNGNPITTASPPNAANSVNNSNSASNTNTNSINNNNSTNNNSGGGAGGANDSGNGGPPYSPSFQETASVARMVEQPDRTYQPAPTPKTAPISQTDRAFRDMSSAARNHSAERAPTREIPIRDGHRDGHRGDRSERDYLRPQASSYRENGGGFFGGLKNSSRSAADMISKGLFGKSSRSGSTNEREPVVDDEHYVIKVINQPLVEQTRLTRISKRLEDSRDKTEFWMPAFPWRAIDYLNYKGTDVEGLYRVPGSGPQIKKWQRRFDEEHDVDLFAQEDLYDINIVGSMLKAWLRELPDELFPKASQERIARECAGADKVPQMLVDELSNLSPFNYYLLFAITCHLSLLLAHSDKNKMDFRNLCICFQPCMKIDAFSFKFLVCDWRDCWKGCRNEARYIEEEYKLFDMPPPPGIAARNQQAAEAAAQQQQSQASEEQAHSDTEKRNISSSGSSKQSHSEAASEDNSANSANGSNSANGGNNGSSGSKTRPKKKMVIVTAPEAGSEASNSSTVSTTLTVDGQRLATPSTQTGDLRPLSPIKPLSPLGF